MKILTLTIMCLAVVSLSFIASAQTQPDSVVINKLTEEAKAQTHAYNALQQDHYDLLKENRLLRKQYEQLTNDYKRSFELIWSVLCEEDRKKITDIINKKE